MALGLVDDWSAEDALRAGRDRLRAREARVPKAGRSGRSATATDRGCARPPGDLRSVPGGERPRFRGFEAPEAAIRCVEAAAEPALRGGSRLRARALPQSSSRARRAGRSATSSSPSARSRRSRTCRRRRRRSRLRRVGIVGAGTMGGGIAMNFANAGLPVTIVEARQRRWSAGFGHPPELRSNARARAGSPPRTWNAGIGLLTGSLDLDDLGGCDLVIEAVFENMELKKDLFARLDGIAKPGAILASNTSYLDIDEIAAVTKRPGACPRPALLLAGERDAAPRDGARREDDREPSSRPRCSSRGGSARSAFSSASATASSATGCWRQRQREANQLVLEGAMPWDVDRVLYEFGFPMGPFAMSDLAGLDIGWSRETSAGASVRDILCERDRRGQKTGAGFYDYDESRTARPSALVEEIIRDVSRRTGTARRSVADEEILERCLYPMINEGAKILEEGKALRASDIDVVWIARLRLAGLSRRPDVLRRRDRPPDRCSTAWTACERESAPSSTRRGCCGTWRERAGSSPRPHDTAREQRPPRAARSCRVSMRQCAGQHPSEG